MFAVSFAVVVMCFVYIFDESEMLGVGRGVESPPSTRVFQMRPCLLLLPGVELVTLVLHNYRWDYTQVLQTHV